MALEYGPASYGPGWSVGPCEIEDCRYCTDGWTGTCDKCGGRTTHQPMWADQPQEWQVEVCPTCGYAINATGFGAGFVQLAYYVSAEGNSFEINHPDNLAMRILKGLDVVEDDPVEYCAVPSCRERVGVWVGRPFPEEALAEVRRRAMKVKQDPSGRWRAEVPICQHHHYRRWYPSITAEGEVTFEVFGPAPR